METNKEEILKFEKNTVSKKIKKETTKKRRTLSLEKKIEILERLKIGNGSTFLAKEYGMNEASIRTIKRNEDSIRKSVARGTTTSAKFSTYKRDELVELVEKALLIWIKSISKKNISMNFNSLRSKALNIFSFLKKKQPSRFKTEFSASKGWFEKFKKRYNLHNMYFKGEVYTGDSKSAKNYQEKLMNIIESNCYLPEQVFNAAEMCLFWRRMPKKLNMNSDMSLGGFETSKDMVTILLCSNASGDHVTKPLMVNRFQRPHALKGRDLKNLSVHWRFNKKVWMSPTLFEEWFRECFVPEVRKYLEERDLEFKVLLLLENSPYHPTTLEHKQVHVEFLPTNTSLLIQPQNQGIFSSFKAYYIKQTFEDVMNKLNEDSTTTILDVWRRFTILNCITNIGYAVSRLKKKTLNSAWKFIWPQIVSEQNITSSENILDEIINVAQNFAGEKFDNLEVPDIEELFEDREVSEEDLADLVLNQSLEDEEDFTENYIEVAEKFDKVLFAEGLKMGREVQDYFLKHDPDKERAKKFQDIINTAFSQYEQLIENNISDRLEFNP